MSDAQIYSQGYRPYDGVRTGLSGARKALIKQSVRHALGLGRQARSKLLPFGIIIVAYLPAIAFIGLAALIPAGSEQFLPSYPDYYGLVAAALYLFAGTITPDLLCSDRRTGMLGIYLSSPLDRINYLAAKAMAVVGLMLLITLGPPLLMLIAFTLQDAGPASLGAWFLELLRVVVGSFVVGLPFAAVAMAVAATTDRRAVASAATMALIAGSASMTEILVVEGNLSPVLRLGNILFLPQALVFRIFDDPGGWSAKENPTWSLWLALAVWTFGSAAYVWIRYRKLVVTK